ncbi:MAG: hypothetical protein QUV06_03240 [Cyanobium sp. CZS 48M]|nr:hypothetical protein [Cyanobium sp. CZS48M]
MSNARRPSRRPRPAAAGLPAVLIGLVLSAGGALAALALLPPQPRANDTLLALQDFSLQLQEVVLASRPQPPRPGDRLLTSAALPGLLAQLERADQSWLPRAEPLGNGRIRYLYKRRLGDPPLSIAQIEELRRNPPSHQLERDAIARLLTMLERSGVQVVIGPPRKSRAAGEWEPAARTLRIRPDVIEKGSVEFARVLNHEAIHVAQSCRRGGLGARPQLLGLSIVLDPINRRHLEDPVYARASPTEIRLEQEAYANQDQLSLGPALLAKECRAPGWARWGPPAAAPAGR